LDPLLKKGINYLALQGSHDMDVRQQINTTTSIFLREVIIRSRQQAEQYNTAQLLSQKEQKQVAKVFISSFFGCDCFVFDKTEKSILLTDIGIRK
jgi:hypothetical protein